MQIFACYRQLKTFFLYAIFSFGGPIKVLYMWMPIVFDLCLSMSLIFPFSYVQDLLQQVQKRNKKKKRMHVIVGWTRLYRNLTFRTMKRRILLPLFQKLHYNLAGLVSNILLADEVTNSVYEI